MRSGRTSMNDGTPDYSARHETHMLGYGAGLLVRDGARVAGCTYPLKSDAAIDWLFGVGDGERGD